MKYTALLVLVSLVVCKSQQKSENVIIITLDGMRWQEIFGGIDSSIVLDNSFNQKKSQELFEKYAGKTKTESRQKLMPNFWNIFSKNGQIYGNRTYQNEIAVSNPYKISFPGYSEIFCGKVDTNIKTNAFSPNPNDNLLQKLNETKLFRNRVAIFGAWAAFYTIFDINRTKLPISNAFKYAIPNPNEKENYIQKMTNESFKPFGENECLDVFTHYQAMEYLKSRKPKALFIGYGETDEWAHAGKYLHYLNAANQADKWIAEIWNFVQSDSQYKNKTILLITTDHGRGIGKLWTDHNAMTPFSEQTWFGIIAPSVSTRGEIKEKATVVHKQFAITISNLLGVSFESTEKNIELK